MNTTQSQTSNHGPTATKQAEPNTKRDRNETPEKTAVKQQHQQGSSTAPTDKQQWSDNSNSPQKQAGQSDKPTEAAPHNQK